MSVALIPYCPKKWTCGTSRSSSDFKGTLFWMAPKALQDVEQSFHQDICSLGCTVVEICQGCPPWVNILQFSFGSVITKITCSNANPLLPEDLFEEGKDFMDKCFQRDPHKRQERHLPASGNASTNIIISSPVRPERKQIRGASFTACKQKEEKITNIPSIIEEFPETSEQNLKITKILLKQFV